MTSAPYVPQIKTLGLPKTHSSQLPTGWVGTQKANWPRQPRLKCSLTPSAPRPWTIRAAAEAVASLGEKGDPAAPGTTLCGTLTIDQDGPQWLTFNIGDSRAYLVAAGSVLQLTTDHSAVQEAKEFAKRTGAELVLPPSNVITRALGAAMPELPQADYVLTPMREGDVVVLCSDGVHGALSEQDFIDIASQDSSAQEIANALVDQAIEGGTRDNATALVIRAQSVVGSRYDGDIRASVRPRIPVRPLPVTTARRAR